MERDAINEVVDALIATHSCDPMELLQARDIVLYDTIELFADGHAVITRVPTYENKGGVWHMVKGENPAYFCDCGACANGKCLHTLARKIYTLANLVKPADEY